MRPFGGDAAVLFVILLEVLAQVNLCRDVQDQSTKTITTEASEKSPISWLSGQSRLLAKSTSYLEIRTAKIGSQSNKFSKYGDIFRAQLVRRSLWCSEPSLALSTTFPSQSIAVLTSTDALFTA
jgi:hypothetical protein